MIQSGLNRFYSQINRQQKTRDSGRHWLSAKNLQD